MSLRTKLLLLVSIAIAASVGAVGWLIEAQTRESFRQLDQDRTSTLVEQFRHEFDREAADVTRGVESVAASEAMLQMALDLLNGADASAYVHAAGPFASTHHLDFLDLLTPDGTIISSAHWRARFGYKQRWFLEQSSTLPEQIFLKPVETPQGNVLGILYIRALKVRGSNFYIIGGRRLDKALLQSLSTPVGMRVFIYSTPIYSTPEQGDGEFLSSSGDAVDQAKLMPLIHQSVEEKKEISAVIQWNKDQQEVFHAMPLPAFAGHATAVLLVGNSLQQQLVLERRIDRIALLIAVCGVLLGVVVSAVVASRITRPLHDLAVAAGEIGRGNWEARVDSASQGSSKDEIGQLAAAFNHMTGELTAQKERLLQSERVAAWRELARRLAHELKNPLFPLQITVENLLRARSSSPEQFDEVFRESTSTLLDEIANLKTIISRFSDFSKMPAPEFQPVDLNGLVRSVVKLFQGQLMREPHRIDPDLQLGQVPLIRADAALIRRVIENLVLNAIDAMPQGGQLIFLTSVSDRYAVFDLTDTGAGLTPEECERLFTPYYTSKQHGTGLGLAIAQSVISDHHGKITVFSAKNTGTTFHIELPLWEEQERLAANERE
ncbi:MAG TPA: HAMP domain-containing sensor histidine kinase [Candidatus Saccharimonadales bacterium]|jgi:two-component system nitrogen regulation sensor histidine kinase NtrY|nr:HAMP domain-containing sensor histidine kinase [Candidatus Saccharimonadales bacterium]